MEFGWGYQTSDPMDGLEVNNLLTLVALCNGKKSHGILDYHYTKRTETDCVRGRETQLQGEPDERKA